VPTILAGTFGPIAFPEELGLLGWLGVERMLYIRMYADAFRAGWLINTTNIHPDHVERGGIAHTIVIVLDSVDA
jgi:hypothetical protein